MDTFTASLASLLIGVAISGSAAAVAFNQYKVDNQDKLQELEHREKTVENRENRLRLKLLRIEGIIK